LVVKTARALIGCVAVLVLEITAVSSVVAAVILTCGDGNVGRRREGGGGTFVAVEEAEGAGILCLCGLAGSDGYNEQAEQYGAHYGERSAVARTRGVDLSKGL